MIEIPPGGPELNKNDHAREAQLRAISIYAKRPELAKGTDRGAAEVREGLSCTYEQDGHRVSMDMPVAIGGSAKDPTPGFFGRAAICACLAIGIKMTASRENMHLDSVRVEIEQDWDNRGVLAIEGTSPVPSDTRIVITVSSQETEDKVSEAITRALAHDPWYLAFRDAQPVSTTISFSKAVA